MLNKTALTLIFSVSTLYSQAPAVVKWVAPKYPVIPATFAEASGVVKATLTIGKDGKVTSARAYSVNQRSYNNQVNRLFILAEEAAKQWLFEPGTPNRSVVIFFAFHLYPPNTPPERLKPEFVNQNLVITKASIVEQPSQELSGI